jgi:hypothetical protein
VNNCYVGNNTIDAHRGKTKITYYIHFLSLSTRGWELLWFTMRNSCICKYCSLPENLNFVFRELDWPFSSGTKRVRNAQSLLDYFRRE